jgi:hypothetical protein
MRKYIVEFYIYLKMEKGMEKVDVLTIPVYTINKSSINTKNSPVKTSSNVPIS